MEVTETMSLKSLTTALTLYRGTSLTLERAAAQSGIAAGRLAAELRSQGVRIEDADRETLAEHGAT